jgi:hypothetical protein
MEPMARFEGEASLEWWANDITCLASFDVSVTIEAAATGWSAWGHVRDPHAANLEAFDFFCEHDPVFILWLAENATIPVTVRRSPGTGAFTLAEVPPASIA